MCITANEGIFFSSKNWNVSATVSKKLTDSENSGTVTTLLLRLMTLSTQHVWFTVAFAQKILTQKMYGLITQENKWQSTTFLMWLSQKLISTTTTRIHRTISIINKTLYKYNFSMARFLKCRCSVSIIQTCKSNDKEPQTSVRCDRFCCCSSRLNMRCLVWYSDVSAARSALHATAVSEHIKSSM